MQLIFGSEVTTTAPAMRLNMPCDTICLVSLAISKGVTKFLQRTPDEFGLFPQVRCQEAICVCDSREGCLEGVFERFGGAR
jgi:hypothetical protein